MRQARDHSRERSPTTFHPSTSNTRSYRDRSDPPLPTKRKHREDATATAAAALPPKKKALATRKEHNYPSVNELKRRIRDVRRLLSRDDLAADARILQERALSGYERDLEDEMERRARSQMIKKYHFVRFLDRKSATKNLNRLLRREKEFPTADPNTSSSETLDSLRRKIHIARVNLNYTIYYPLNDKYISLYAEQKQKTKPEHGTDDDAHSRADGDYRTSEQKKTLTPVADTEKPGMWYTIEKCMQDGTLDLLREGKLSTTTGDVKSKSASASASEKNKKHKKESTSTSTSTKSKRKSKLDNDDRTQKFAKRSGGTMDVVMRDGHGDNGDDDESDGGFFEM